MKRAFYTIADNNNIKYANIMAASLKKFHPKEEIILFNEEQVKETGDPHFWYRATPALAKTLFSQGFDMVCKLDADQVITGNLDHIWEGDFDIAVVNNSNPREHKNYPIQFLDIHPLAYVNCGFVVMKNTPFVKHWFDLCYSDHFQNYQYREQDLLNMMVFYMNKELGGPYKVKFLDRSDKWHGLISKGYWPQIEKETVSYDKDLKTEIHPPYERLILRKNEEWPVDQDKQIVAIHFAGGNVPDKVKFGPYFKPEVAKYLEGLAK